LRAVKKGDFLKRTKPKLDDNGAIKSKCKKEDRVRKEETSMYFKREKEGGSLKTT